METVQHFAELILTPGVLLLIFFLLNRRIDDLRTNMKSDHANLSEQLKLVDQHLSEKIDSIDKRLESLRQDFTRHLETHLTKQSNP